MLHLQKVLRGPFHARKYLGAGSRKSCSAPGRWEAASRRWAWACTEVSAVAVAEIRGQKRWRHCRAHTCSALWGQFRLERGAGALRRSGGRLWASEVWVLIARLHSVCSLPFSISPIWAEEKERHKKIKGDCCPQLEDVGRGDELTLNGEGGNVSWNHTTSYYFTENLLFVQQTLSPVCTTLD